MTYFEFADKENIGKTLEPVKRMAEEHGIKNATIRRKSTFNISKVDGNRKQLFKTSRLESKGKSWRLPDIIAALIGSKYRGYGLRLPKTICLISQEKAVSVPNNM